MTRIHKRPFALYRKTDDFQYNARCEKDSTKKDHPVIGGLKRSLKPEDFNGLETAQKEVPLDYVLLSLAFIDLFTPQYSFHFYPL